MEKLKKIIKQMNKKQKELSIIAIIIIVFIIIRLICQSSVITKSNSTSNHHQQNSTISSNSSTYNTEKVSTSYQAITYAKEYANSYSNLSSQVKSSAYLHSIRRIEITDSSAKENYSDYEVLLKGNGSGYTDTYDTKFKTFTFDAKLRVDKKTGSVSVSSVTTKTK